MSLRRYWGWRCDQEGTKDQEAQGPVARTRVAVLEKGGPSSLVIPSQSSISLLNMDLRMCLGQVGQYIRSMWEECLLFFCYFLHTHYQGRDRSYLWRWSSTNESCEAVKKKRVNKSISLFSRWLIYDKNKFLYNKYIYFDNLDF